MKSRASLAFALCFISLSAQAQSVEPSVSVFGVAKNAYYQQTDAGVVSYLMSGIYAFVEGSGISSDFPLRPVTLTLPGGAAYSLELSSGDLGSEWSLRYDSYEAGFTSEAALNASFPDGRYTFASGGYSYDLQLSGGYVDMPLVQFSAGHWEEGRLILTAEEATSDWYIASNFTNANGFRSISVADEAFSFHVFSYDDGSFPGAVSSVIAGGSLKPGMTYSVEVEFDNVVDYVNPAEGDLRNGFALYSTSTFVTVTVVPEPQPWLLLAAGMLPLLLAARRTAHQD